MNILLTADEKAIAVQDEMKRVGEGQMRDYSDIIQRALLKKVVEELGKMPRYYPEPSGNVKIDKARVMGWGACLEYIKQALLKEVEGE